MTVIPLKVILTIEEVDQNSIHNETLILQNQLRKLGVDSANLIQERQPSVDNAKGDAVTIGAIVLGVTTVSIPAIISFIQNWLVVRRKIIIEAPNGTKVEFIPEKQYSEEEILSLARKLASIDGDDIPQK